MKAKMNETELQSLIAKFNPYFRSLEHEIFKLSNRIQQKLTCVLDAGCGEGRHSHLWKHVNDTIIGVDIDKDSLKKIHIYIMQ
jgi:SAM-dependent methyltransferase